jgi:EAL domain-containing protein (putative c-di-GMP-specific phosphodiesterase class I)/DNA-binding response OmpR family regulator
MNGAVADPTQRPAGVLIVEDDGPTRAVYEAALSRAGLSARAVPDGESAMSFLSDHAVDVVLLDMTLPGMSGIGVLEAIRSSVWGATLPVLLVTGHDAIEDRVRGLEAGATDYIVKPVDLVELTARVRAQLRHVAAWGAIHADLERRLDALALLRRVRRFDAPDETADAVCCELTRLDTYDGAAVLVVRGGRRISVLAARGALAPWMADERIFEGETASSFADRLQAGPWIEAIHPRAPSLGEIRMPSSSPSPSSAMAVAPIEGTSGTVGAIALTKTAPWHRSGSLLSSAIDFSVAVGSLIIPELERAHALNESRARLLGIVDRHEFSVAYQPVVELRTGDVVGYEGLTRWADGVRPDLRFSEAIHIGIGAAIERATAEAVIASAGHLGADMWLSVNASASVLLGGELNDVLGGNERPIVVEVTEHEPIDDDPAFVAALRAIPGIRLAVDDAGAGYASLQRVLALQPDFVKLDTLWTRGIDTDRARQALVHGLARFGEEDGCVLISEGIETEAERDTLADLGVPLGQGYLFGRPTPVA